MNKPDHRERGKKLLELKFEAIHEAMKLGRELDRLTNSLRLANFAMRGPSFVLVPMIERIKCLAEERAVYIELALSYAREQQLIREYGYD